MKYGSLFAFLAATLLLVPTAAFGQGGDGRGGMSQGGRYGPPAPPINPSGTRKFTTRSWSRRVRSVTARTRRSRK